MYSLVNVHTRTHTHTHTHTQLPTGPITDAVPSGDVRLAILSRKIFSTPNEWDKRAHELELMEELVVCVCVTIGFTRF